MPRIVRNTRCLEHGGSAILSRLRDLNMEVPQPSSRFGTFRRVEHSTDVGQTHKSGGLHPEARLEISPVDSCWPPSVETRRSRSTEAATAKTFLAAQPTL